MALINRSDITLKAGDGATPTEVFTAIAAVTSVSWGTVTRNIVDVTDFDATNFARTFAGGLVDYGEVTFDLNFDPTNSTHDADTGVLKYFEDTAARNFQIVFNDAGAETFGFAGIVQSFSMAAPNDDKVSGSVTIKITGKPTFTT